MHVWIYDVLVYTHSHARVPIIKFSNKNVAHTVPALGKVELVSE